MNEITRIKKAYAKRSQVGKDEFFNKFSPGSLYNWHLIQRETMFALKKNGITHLGNLQILDVGCGRGKVLREFVQLGATPRNLNGIDLLWERIDYAKKLSPNINFHFGNAENLPFKNGCFQIILCFVTFSSIFDFNMKQKISKEMDRVLSKDGIILWYDFFVNNPWNPDVRGVRKKEIYQLFPNFIIKLKRITIIPQVNRFLAPHSWLACYFIEKMSLIHTHYFGVIKKNPARGK